jgi:hypothetical protein
MAINTIASSNTFTDWVLVTNQVVSDLNDLRSNNYTKSSNTFIVGSTGVGLQVNYDSLLQGNVTVGSATLSTLSVGSNVTTNFANTVTVTGNIILSGSLQSPGGGITSGSINLISGNIVTFTSNAITANIIVANNISTNTVNAAYGYIANLSIGNITNSGIITANNLTDYSIVSKKLANTGVTAGSYGGPTSYPIINIDTSGRITGVIVQPVITSTNQTTFGVTLEQDYFNGDGSTLNFNLTRSITGANTIEVFISGVKQYPSNYSASGALLTFNTAPPSGTNNIMVQYIIQPGAVQLVDVLTDTSNVVSGRAATPLSVNTVYAYAQASFAAANAALVSSPSAAVQFGSFGVGTAPSGTTGEIRATNNITAYYSDDRLKIRLGNIENALDKLMSLNGFYFHPNDEAQSLGYANNVQVGVSAQEVQAVQPQVVVPAPISDKYLTVHYEKLIPLLIQAIKELKAEVDELKGK